MEPVLIAAAAVVVLLLIGLVAGRNRRDASLAPARLGPSWAPSVPEDAEPALDPDDRARRAGAAAARVEDADEATAAAVLEVWDEYLGVLGLAPLPAGHHRRVYDPYDPPVAKRGADGRAVPDRERVARDVASRIGVDEALALEILQHDDGPTPRG
ncbi:hypothetical protein FTX61_13105 [Nitriliruptoraceae bacterium ZYF776]|nr:hypothetical protein [Profundirhabdus halotolerans]